MGKTTLGQHFLQNYHIVQRILEYAEVDKYDSVLEIGPGKGILTKELATHAKNVICVEIDDHLVKQLQHDMPDNVTLIQEDITKIELSKLPSWNKCVANLPYQISSPFTFQLLHHGFELAVLMYQRDFAERMVAKPGSKSYSRLSVHVYYHAECSILEQVPKTQFLPQPKVDSSLVKLLPRTKPPFQVKDKELFFTITTTLFSHRRKQIRNSLSSLLDTTKLDENISCRRVEELAPEEIGSLSNQVFEILHSS